MSQDLIKTVQELYAAFGRGDLNAVLEGLAEDVDWGLDSTTKNVPWYGIHKGRAATAKGFFQPLGEGTEFHVFEPHGFMTQGNTVFNLLRYEATVKRTGKKVSMLAGQYWTFKNGKVSLWRGFEDTAKLAEALKG
jgi:ketosteroid isomerase-like protein